MNDMKPQISRQHNSRAVGMWITQEMDAMTVGMEQRFCENLKKNGGKKCQKNFVPTTLSTAYFLYFSGVCQKVCLVNTTVIVLFICWC